jgi:DNA primase large subunit
VELNKKKVDTKQRKVQELLKNEFEESISKINPLLQKIEETDTEISQMVYDLYGLTEEEIKIIDDSL